MNGVLVIDKAAGPTSHDVVAAVRRLLKIKKVGHTGTLDPAATGVLPLVLGKATKVARFLSSATKSYRAVVRLGITTDTLDAVGEVLSEREVNVEQSDVEAKLEAFRGEFDQVPPMYSAKKIDGKRLYELARSGVEVERPAKRVTITHLELLSFDGRDIELDVTCSAGTYMRVLAQDLGELLGCGGHLYTLRRTQAGPFEIEQSITLDALTENPERAGELLVPMGDALEGLPSIAVPADIGRMIANGYQLTVADLRNLDTPNFDVDTTLTLREDSGSVIAIVTSLMTSADLMRSRREQHAFKTERVVR